MKEHTQRSALLLVGFALTATAQLSPSATATSAGSGEVQGPSNVGEVVVLIALIAAAALTTAAWVRAGWVSAGEAKLSSHGMLRAANAGETGALVSAGRPATEVVVQDEDADEKDSSYQSPAGLRN